MALRPHCDCTARPFPNSVASPRPDGAAVCDRGRFGANSSNPHLASRGKTGVLVSCGAAILCGAAITLINFFWTVGQAVN
ncbi:DUF6112 family protein [Micromonospora sp. DT178]|uniref:DUF6112 family protein n=1 Tax=Micromonospora sp. DT178 TaxID=3393436 RepID=UPI003CEB2E0A